VAETIPYAQLLMRRARVEVRINDIPVAVKETDGISNAMIPIREYLMSGKNTAQFIIEPTDFVPSYKETEPSIREDCAVRLRIAEIEDGVFLNFKVGKELFDMASQPTTEAVPPVIASGTFEATSAHRWAWSMATEIDPIKDRAEIDDFVSKVSEMWAKQDADGLIKVLQPSITDQGKAYPANPEKYIKMDFRNEVGSATSEEWKPVPFDPERAVYRSVANGKMIEVLGTDGLPLVRTETEDPSDPVLTDGYFPLPMMIGYKDGKLAGLI